MAECVCLNHALRRWLRLYGGSMINREMEEAARKLYPWRVLSRAESRRAERELARATFARIQELINPPLDIQKIKPTRLPPPELSGVVHDYFKTERKRNHGKTV